MHTAKYFTALLALTLAAGTAHAGLSVDMFQPVDFPGWKVYQVFWDGGGTQDWTSAALRVDLPQGDVYNYDYPDFDYGILRAAGSFPPIPEVLYDTWVGPEDAGVADGASDLGGGAFSLDAPQISVAWFNTSTLDTDHVQIAQFTVSNDAMGTWQVISAGELLEGVITPEPATLALLALACPMLMRRR